MNVVVISDVTFDLVLKQWEQQPDLNVRKYVYSGHIIPELMNLQAELDDVQMIVVHIDSFFYRYTDQYIRDVLQTVRSLAKSFTGTVLLSNQLTNGRHTSLLKNNVGQHEQVILELNDEVKEILGSDNIYFYDVRKLVEQIGIQQAYNFKLGFLYQMPYTKPMLGVLASEIASMIRFLQTPEKKAILVDCDNTLWKGILGEDGLENIQCDRNAQGILFYQFQEFLLEKKREGFILGLCSKNNEQDVKEAFDNLNMPLRWDDFLVKKVNWQNKEQNLREAAEELNIGLDSFIFIDDNEFELQSIRLILPEVHTRKLSHNYEEFLALCDDYCFKRKRVTREDLDKNEQYLAEQQRNNARNQVHSFEEYVSSLEIRYDFSVNAKSDLPRLSQLTEKTNQFNFNKEPLSVTQLEHFINEGNLVYGLRVADKFGDYGLVGLMLVEVKPGAAVIRNFLMSCRALGRMIEQDFYDHVVSDLSSRGLVPGEIIFRETAKNKPARLFMDKLNTRAKKDISV